MAAAGGSHWTIRERLLGKKMKKGKNTNLSTQKPFIRFCTRFIFFLFRVEIQHTFHTLALTWKALETRGLNCFQGTVLELKLNCSMDWVVLTTALIKSYGAAASWFLGLRISCGDCLTGWNFFFATWCPVNRVSHWSLLIRVGWSTKKLWHLSGRYGRLIYARSLHRTMKRQWVHDIVALM